MWYATLKTVWPTLHINCHLFKLTTLQHCENPGHCPASLRHVYSYCITDIKHKLLSVLPVH